ncbi:hypothetical protein I3843_16G094700 [Carya illinoinensis]|nr:hypothetical protein I3843_16G094700 [Carya illinoinensis]
MASNMMHQLHLKPYPGQLSSSPRFSAPIAMNRPCNSNTSTYTAKLFSSFSNPSRFVVANTTASNEIVLVTPEQPFKGTSLNVLNMSDDQIMNHMYAGHHHVDHDADKNFDPNSVFVVVDNILKQATHTVDIALLELSLLAQKINISLLLRKMQTVLCRRQIGN